MAETLGIYTRYGRLGASSRLRYFNYRDAFESAGFAPVFKPFFSDAYLRRLYAGKGKSRLLGAAALLRRLGAATHLPDKLLIEYELLPELSYEIESRFLRNRHYVLNFDDDVWLKYGNRKKLSDKFNQLISRASGVICANDMLLERVQKLHSNAIKIPTAINLDSYPTKVAKFPTFTIAWIGTPVTYRYLELHADALRAMSNAVDFELLIIATSKLAKSAIPGVRMRFADWSESQEGELLARCHVGIMPLPTNDAFAAGKSAFKLIQYLAAGLPAIASPVGENLRVLRPGETGFFAETAQAWADCLIRLYNDNTREQFSVAARSLAYEYSTQKYATIYAQFLKNSL
jgi:glycosyltransferase involved in cell wall biosynthesis